MNALTIIDPRTASIDATAAENDIEAAKLLAVLDLLRKNPKDDTLNALALHDAAMTYLAAKTRAEQADSLASVQCGPLNRFDDFEELSDSARQALKRYTICAKAAQTALEDYRRRLAEWESARAVPAGAND